MLTEPLTENEITKEFPKLYTVDEAAAIVRLAPMTLWAHLNSGKLLRTKVGGKTFIKESELRKMITDLPLGPTGRKPQQRKWKKAKARQ